MAVAKKLTWSLLIRFFSSSLVSLCIVTAKSTLINYRDCKNGYFKNWNANEDVNLFDMLEYTEILQSTIETSFLESQVWARSYSYAILQQLHAILHLSFCSLFSRPKLLCDGLLKRHCDKCGSMNRFIHTHTHCARNRSLTNWTGKLVSINRMHACVRV